MRTKLKFNLQELGGSFGDIGTDLPLIVGMLQATNLDSASVFFMFGLMQALAGLFYGLPMPMQPLKAMAVLVITHKISAEVIFGGGLTIALFMLLLTCMGALTGLAKLIPLCVVRGVQFGLGLSLASLALKTYIPSDHLSGYILAGMGFLIMIFLPKNSRFPAAGLVIFLGMIYALSFKIELNSLISGIGFTLPKLHQPTFSDMMTGFVILALPQIPLSLSNSVIATHQTIKDLFPQEKIPIGRIGLTYSLANLFVPFFGGIPVCHGCGGLAGHYALGARTGGSVVIYGLMYLLIGLFFSAGFQEVVKFFPQPILGVVLLFEALTLMLLISDQGENRKNLTISLMVGLLAFLVPQGYLVGLIVGTSLYYFAPVS